MKSITEQTLEYFSATNNDFWKWAENGTVIEWMNGQTICYREDLLLVLRGLSRYGLPPIGTVLLLMGACQNRWKKSQQSKEELTTLFNIYKELSPNIFLENYFNDAIKFLDMVNELPENLRRGSSRVHLFQEIFKKENNRWVEDSDEVVDEFLSGRLNQNIFTKNLSGKLSAENFRRDLMCLTSAGRRFLTREVLELSLRTGLKELPTPIDLEEKEEEDHEEKSLLDQLKEDAKTEGIARLCQRIIAGLNIPMHSQGVSDQSFGGVSDITNRGDIDKLLLSELAYDDTTLMVRLANNEAMYLRREELPSNLHKERIILMDSTIKMWGVPRVFATSVGLACAIQDKNVASISAHLLSGEKIHPVDLSTEEGVTKGLGQLFPDLHCADALHLFVEKNTIDEQTELILITDEVSLENEDFKKTLNEVRGALTYLITINRQGRLHFYEYGLSGRRLISTTLYDLNELLFKSEKKTSATKSKIDETVSKDLPLIYQHKPFSILYPTPSIRFTQKNTFDFGSGGVAAISNDNRILYWKEKNFGARELLTFSKSDDRFEVTYFDGWLYLLRMSTKYEKLYESTENMLTKWYAINLNEESQSFEVDFSEKEIYVQHVRAEHGRFYFIDDLKEIYFIEQTTGDLERYAEQKSFPGRDKINFNKVKKIVNNGYTTLKKAKRITILCDEDGYEDGLKLNDWELKFTKHSLCFEQNKKKGSNIHFEDERHLKKDDTIFRKAVFENGSYIIADSNGLMHLISSDENIPQITIPMVVGGVNAAAWASDGVLTGSSYFFRSTTSKRIPPKEFEKKYIQPFLSNLLNINRNILDPYK